MTEWVALLRGVNVNGITVRSAELRALLAELGFADVRTVLASGNATFAASERPGALKERIEAALAERFGYDAWIVLRTRAQLDAAIAAFPFDAADAGRQPYVVFGSDDAVLARLAAAAEDLDQDVDPVRTGNGVLYWNPRTGTTVDTAFGKLLARREYRSSTTSRNLRTLEKIAAR